MRIKLLLGLLLVFGLLNCSDEETTVDLNGKWVDADSFGLRFIEFYSKTEGRFGLYSKDHEEYEDFNYRLFDNKIAIDFINDNEGEVTILSVLPGLLVNNSAPSQQNEKLAYSQLFAPQKPIFTCLLLHDCSEAFLKAKLHSSLKIQTSEREILFQCFIRLCV